MPSFVRFRVCRCGWEFLFYGNGLIAVSYSTIATDRRPLCGFVGCGWWVGWWVGRFRLSSLLFRRRMPFANLEEVGSHREQTIISPRADVAVAQFFLAGESLQAVVPVTGCKSKVRGSGLIDSLLRIVKLTIHRVCQHCPRPSRSR